MRLFTLHSAVSIRAVPSAEHPDILILEFRGEEVESLVFGEGGGDLISVKLTQGQVANLLAAIRGRTGLGV